MKFYLSLLIIFFLCSVSCGRSNLRYLGEEREMAQPDDDSTTAVENTIITFKATAGTFYIKGEVAVSFISESSFKLYEVGTTGTNTVEYTLIPKIVCDGTKDGGKTCEGTTTDDCAKIKFSIKESTLTVIQNLSGYEGNSLKELTADNEIKEANDALKTYSNASKCVKKPSDDNFNLPENTQITFKIENKGVVHVLNTAAVRISGSEYTYYTVTRTEDKSTGTKLTFTPKSECLGKSNPQSYYTCPSTSPQTCDNINDVKVKYTSDESMTIESPSEGYTDLKKDTSQTNIELYKNNANAKCNVKPVPDAVNLKYVEGEYTVIITKTAALKYKTNDNMEYTYYSTVKKVDGSLGGSKYTLTGNYKCANKQSTTCTSAEKATTDCDKIELEVNYYKDSKDDKEYIKIVKLSEISASLAEEADLTLVTNRNDKSTCTGGDSGGDKTDNSYPEPIEDNKVIKRIKDEINYILAKDKYYIVKENNYQISFPLTRTTEGNNNFTTFQGSDDETKLVKSQSGYYLQGFTTEIKNLHECIDTDKPFVSISWMNNNCHNKTGIVEKLIETVGDNSNGINLNLTLKNGTIEVHHYLPDNKLGVFFGNITTEFTPSELEDIGWSVIPTILFSVVILLLL